MNKIRKNETKRTHTNKKQLEIEEEDGKRITENQNAYIKINQIKMDCGPDADI